MTMAATRAWAGLWLAIAIGFGGVSVAQQQEAKLTEDGEFVEYHFDGEAILETSPLQAQAFDAGDGQFRLRAGRGDEIRTHRTPLPTANTITEVDLVIEGAGAAGLVLRSTSSGDRCYSVLLDERNQTVRILTLPWQGDLHSVPLEVETGRSYHLRVGLFDVDGETAVEVSVDGERVAEFAEPRRDLPARYVGLLTHGTDASFDNLAVRGLAAEPDEEPLLAESFDGGAWSNQQMEPRPLETRWEDGALVLRDTWPEAGVGPGSAVRLAHGIEDAEEVWVPHVAPSDEYVIADHAFRSPALIVASDEVALALIPDVDDVRRAHESGWATWMDYDHPARTVTFAAGAYRHADHHVLFWPADAEYSGQEIELRVHVLTSDEAADLENPYGMVARWIWERWGSPRLAEGGSQLAPLNRYAQYINRWAFEPEPVGWGDTVWQSFEIDGRECGAPAFIVDVAQHPSIPMDERRWREQRSVWNQAWFSTQRCANGLLRFARQVEDDELARRAELMTEIALAAPQEDGLFPAVYTCGGGGYSLYPDTPGWDEAFWTNSNRRPPGVSGDAIHILDAAFTARLLLEWHGLTGNDEAMDMILGLADRLVDLQLPSGAYPGWIEPDGTIPDTLREGPESAMGAALLLELLGSGADLSADRETAYGASARQALAYLADGPVDRARWEDFETYFSCCRWWGDRIGEPIERNGVYKSNTFSPFWCAEAFLAGYRATGDAGYLALGRRCLDELSLYQQVWDPPYIPAPCHGGFGVMNADGEWNDARQSLFAPLYLEYYEETGNAEYFERGVSALRASFAMLYCPENEAVREEYERVHPFFGPESFGFMMENIAHGGPGSEPIGPFTIYTWGNGAALASYAKIRDLYGDVYLDLERRQAFGIDGCGATLDGDSLTILDPYGREELLLRDSAGGERTVELEDGQAVVPY
jgi:hypothetical protein